MLDLFDFAASRQTQQPSHPQVQRGDRPALAMRAARILADQLARRRPITRQDLTKAMTTAFAGSDADGAWSPREAYDCLEAGLVLAIRRLGILLHPGAAKPEHAIEIIQGLEELLVPQTRRTSDTLAFQQFSTPPSLGWLAARALRPSANDTILEPSAGTGLLAAFPALVGARTIVNEIADFRRGLLAGLYPNVLDTDALYLASALPADIRPTAIVMNPPFSVDANLPGRRSSSVGLDHIKEAAWRLEPHGRLAAIIGANIERDDRHKPFFDDLSRILTLRADLKFAGSVYRRFGTDTETRLLVFDKTPNDEQAPVTGSFASAADALASVDRIPPRLPIATPNASATATTAGPNTQPPLIPIAKQPGPSKKPSSARHAPLDSSALKLEPAEPLDYKTIPAAPADGALADSIYEPYVPKTIRLDTARPHPSPLVETAALAAVAPPDPVYRPTLPRRLVTEGRLSLAQLEAVVYTGQAHAKLLAADPNANEKPAANSPQLTESRTAEPQPIIGNEAAPNLPYRQGFMIGDATGVGKGAEVAAVILDNFHAGRTKAVWLSESDKLIEDARRDWSWIGRERHEIFPLHSIKPDTAIPHEYGVLFSNYATFRSGSHKTGRTRLRQIADWLGAEFDGVIVFDECHNLANAVSEKSERGDTKPSLQGLAALDFQRLLPNARILYVSATGATELKSLCYAVRLGLWGPGTEFDTRQAFVAEMQKGGTCALECVGQDLKALGLYLARNLSFDGVEYAPLVHELTAEQTELYDTLADAWALVLNHIGEAMKIVKITDGDGKALNSRAKASRMSQFWSANQRFWNQVITSLKLPTVIAAIERDLQDGHAVVCQLTNTQEAITERAIGKLDENQNLDDLDTTPRQAIMDLVDRTFPVHQYRVHQDEDGNVRSELMTVDEKPVVNPEALALKQSLLQQLALTRIPPGPLEAIIDRFGADQTAEITGRRRRVVLKTADSTETHVLENRPGSANLTEAEAFNDDKKRLLVFSSAGAAGRSYHSDRRFKNHRRRIHYLLQPGWRSTTAIQGLGRTHRTNQSQPPLYRLCTTNLAGERRFISTIARRLDQLGAITRGMRQAGSQNIFQAADNLENMYARQALDSLLDDIRRSRLPAFASEEFEKETGLKLLDGANNDLVRQIPITQFLNRMLSLRVARQNALFKELENRLAARIEKAIDDNTYDAGVETIRPKSLVIKDRKLLHTHPGSHAAAHLVTLGATVEIQYNPFDRIVETYGHREGFAFHRNAQSKHVAAVYPALPRTEVSGHTTERVRMFRPGKAGFENLDAFQESRWEPIDAKRARALWQAEIERSPKTSSYDLHLVAGALLPIWMKLPRDSVRIYRMKTDCGQKLLGRVIEPTQIPQLLAALGHDQTLTAQNVLAHLDAGGTVRLANKWLLKKSIINNQARIEITQVESPRTTAPVLQRRGVLLEIIAWAPRFLIPNRGRAEILQKILEYSPAKELIAKRREAA